MKAVRRMDPIEGEPASLCQMTSDLEVVESVVVEGRGEIRSIARQVGAERDDRSQSDQEAYESGPIDGATHGNLTLARKMGNFERFMASVAPLPANTLGCLAHPHLRLR